MKRFFNFLGNIVTIIVTLFIYSLIQLLYFYPFKLQRKYHLDSKLFIAITILFTIIGILIVYGMYRRQLKTKMIGGLIGNLIGIGIAFCFLLSVPSCW